MTIEMREQVRDVESQDFPQNRVSLLRETPVYRVSFHSYSSSLLCGLTVAATLAPFILARVGVIVLQSCDDGKCSAGVRQIGIGLIGAGAAGVVGLCCFFGRSASN